MPEPKWFVVILVEGVIVLSNRTFVFVLGCFVFAMAFETAFGDSPSKNHPGISAEKPAAGLSVAVDGHFMVPYTITIPGSEVGFQMIPVPGGEFLMGSPKSEPGHREDEGPQVKVTVDPMWVAKTEVTWAQYKQFMNLYDQFKKFEEQKIRSVGDNLADAVTAPTPLYDETYTYEYGQEDQQPAVTMSQYGAQQFTKWLSKLTGMQLRLPTEAEWEYAARAGTTTEYIFGDTTDNVDAYAWYFDNADEGQAHVGKKKPNAFGLHDMCGNAAEWTVNKYTANGYKAYVGKANNATEMVVWPKTDDSSCVVRGGSWEDFAKDLRVAQRLESNYSDWKDTDPQEPKSPWWMTDDPVRGIGMRVFQSYTPLPAKVMTKFWDANAEETQYQVDFKLDEGRGAIGIVDKTLPAAIKALGE